jgi:arginine utilization regulatory protein
MKKVTGIEKILIVDSDTDYYNRLSEVLMRLMYKDNKLKILYSANEEEVLIQLKKNPDIKLVLIDDSIELEHTLNYIKKWLKTKILIFSDQAGNISEPEVINKLDTDSIKNRIIAQLDNYNKSAKDSETSLRQDIEYLMGKGKVISKVLDVVEKYAETDEPVLIEGATGTGKELIVNYISHLSDRKKIPVNCGTLSRELANSELFGSKKGAFTGAQDKKGFVEEAGDGILFLDEFNSLPHDVQVNLLRLIEYGTFIRVGDTVERKANVRIIAAGNTSFKESMEKNELRLDLYERFVKTIYVPTLKERIEDIDCFIDRFIAEEGIKADKAVSISREARKILISHDWPGNIRELKHFIKKMVIEVEMDKKSKKYLIQAQSVLEGLDEQPQNTANVQKSDYSMRTAKKTAMLQALNKAGGNNEEAIKLLGISHGNYYDLKKKYGI